MLSSTHAAAWCGLLPPAGMTVAALPLLLATPTGTQALVAALNAAQPGSWEDGVAGSRDVGMVQAPRIVGRGMTGLATGTH